MLLLLALPLAAFAAFQARDGDDAARPSQVQTATGTSANARSAPAESLPKLDLQRLEHLARRHGSEQAPVDPFAVPGAKERAAAEAEALAAARVAPPPPQAPALPFRYIGQQEEGGARAYFLEQEERLHIVRIGEKIGDGWRLDAAGDDALTFTYLPLGQKRRLPLGGAG